MRTSSIVLSRGSCGGDVVPRGPLGTSREVGSEVGVIVHHGRNIPEVITCPETSVLRLLSGDF